MEKNNNDIIFLLRSDFICVMQFVMNLDFKYRGRGVTVDEIEFIKKLIANNPDASRRALSVKLCKAWNWTQANGALRDMVCRGFMLELHRAGYIQLPEKKASPNNPFVNRNKPGEVKIDRSPISESVKNLAPLQFRQVRRTKSEGLFNGLIEQYHYLGYTQPVGEHLKYIVFSGQRPVACFVWCSAPRHIGSRDKYIGWSKPEREKNLSLIACNSRFLILPWVKVPNLASHLLGRIVKKVAADWQSVYRHKLFYLETFVDTERFTGSCYRAANWIYIGKTTGRGENGQTFKANRSIKAVWGYPLSKDFRYRLIQGAK